MTHDTLSTMTDAQLIEAHRLATEARKSAEETEKQLRLALVARLFQSPNEGTNNVALQNGWTIKAVFKNNFTATNKEGVCDAALAEIRSLGNEGAFIADRLISWKPDVSIAEYRKLDERYRKIIDRCVTIKPALPTVEYVPPKS